MKRIILFIALVMPFYLASSQQMQFDWITQAGGPGWDIVTDMKELSNGELAVVGTFYESINFPNDTLKSKGSRDIFIAQYASNGSLSQVISLGGEGYDYVKTVETYGENQMILPLKFYNEIEVSGKEYSGVYSNNFLISWLDQNLDLSNELLLSSTKEFDITSLKPTPEGACFFTGWFTDTLFIADKVYESLKSKDGFIGKISASGELEWFNHLKGDGDNVPTSFVTANKLNYYVMGTTVNGCFSAKLNPKRNSDALSHLFVAELDDVGTVQNVFYPLSGKEIEPVSLVADSNSLWVLANIKNNVFTNDKAKLTPLGKSDVLLISYNLQDSSITHCQIGGTGNDFANDLIQSGENMLVTGLYSEKLNFGDKSIEAQENGTDIFIATIDCNCNPQNIFTLTGESSEFPCSAFASESGVYVTGEFRNKIRAKNMELISAGKEDIFLARVENCSAKNTPNITKEIIDDSNGLSCWELDAGSDYVDYSWNDDISNSRYLVVSEQGKYSVTVKDFFGCSYTTEIELNIEKSGNIEKNILSKEFKLYPTVTSDFVYWEPASAWENSNAVVTVFNAAGRKIRKNEISKLNAQAYSLNFSSEVEGTYLVEISGQGFRKVSKVMVKK